MSKHFQFKRAALGVALACGVAATAPALAAAAFQVVIPLSISGQIGSGAVQDRSEAIDEEAGISIELAGRLCRQQHEASLALTLTLC